MSHGTAPTLRTDARKGKVRPSKMDEVLMDIACDEAIRPELRWPRVSTRGSFQSKGKGPNSKKVQAGMSLDGTQERELWVPDFYKLHKKAPCALTTQTVELRREQMEEEKLKALLRVEREEKAEKAEEARKVDASKAVTARVKELVAATEAQNTYSISTRQKRDKVRAQWAKEKRADLYANDKAWDDKVKGMEAEATDRSKRPFLFEQVSLDVQVMQEKQKAYDKFESVVRKQGLSDLLDDMAVPE